MSGPSEPSNPVRQALSVLEVRRFVLAIHDQSFPSRPDEDLGRGSPYSRGARDLLTFVARAGFDGVQLGPQGDTTLDNPSPYDGALFTRSPLSIAPATLVDDHPEWEPLASGLLADAVTAVPGHAPDRVRYRPAWQAARALLGALHARFAAAPARFPSLARRFAEFRQTHAANLDGDGLYQALTVEHGTDDWRRWPAPDRSLAALTPARQAGLRERHAGELDRHAFGQFVLGEQHLALRRAAGAADTPLSLFGDLPIGFSHRDLWTQGALFRRDYVMGAPPSRTNPDGQPWGFPVLDPDQYFAGAAAGATRAPGPVLRLVVARVDQMLRDFDGLRIDHPHGLVCPWVYAADDPDPAAAVSRGARLFCSPHLPDHPALGRLAIPEVQQLSADPGIARYADDWVRALRDDQVSRYGVLFDAIMGRVAAAGRRTSDVVCEVLSTWPYPLRRVMERYDLGRFCVLQKADLTRATDVYRAENVAARDWIMVGNHDTRPVWALAESWHGTAAGAQWAGYLADLLMPGAAAARRARLARWLSLDARHLCHGLFATLFASRASHVSIFFADLFGLREIYNRPGIVDADNWTLRLPPDWQARHAQRLRSLDALNLPLALALALASGAPAPQEPKLGQQLLAQARAQTPLLDEEIASLLEPGGGATGS